MISNYKVIQYSILFLFLVYIGKSIDFTKNGIIATLLAIGVIVVLYYSDKSNEKIVENKVTVLGLNLSFSNNITNGYAK